MIHASFESLVPYSTLTSVGAQEPYLHALSAPFDLEPQQ